MFYPAAAHEDICAWYAESIESAPPQGRPALTAAVSHNDKLIAAVSHQDNVPDLIHPQAEVMSNDVEASTKSLPCSQALFSFAMFSGTFQLYSSPA